MVENVDNIAMRQLGGIHFQKWQRKLAIGSSGGGIMTVLKI